MMEKSFSFARSEARLVEKIIDDENVAINHIILAQGDYVPEHYSNSNVYLIIISGTMSLKLGEQEVRPYRAGTIVQVPYNVKMNIRNDNPSLLEFFVVKAPSPRHFSAG